MNVIGLSIGVVIVLVACLPEVTSKGKLGEICNQDWECTVFGSSCEKGYCKCKSTHLELDGKCVVEFGKPCFQSIDTCKGTNVECRYAEEGEVGYGVTCMCHTNFTLHATPDTCRAKIGSICSVAKTGDCNDGTCVASPCQGKVCEGDSCYVENGKPCTSGEVTGSCFNHVCMVETCNQGGCPTGRCDCTVPGLVANKKKSRCLPDLDKDCNSECADTNAECTKGKCSCKKMYQESSSKVWALECKKSLGVPCNTSAECAQERAACEVMSRDDAEKVCICGDGFVAKQDRSKCLQEATGVGSPCEEHLQCLVKLGKKSECKDKKCDCKLKYEYDEDDGICVRS